MVQGGAWIQGNLDPQFCELWWIYQCHSSDDIMTSKFQWWKHCHPWCPHLMISSLFDRKCKTSKGPNTERSVHLPRNEGIPWQWINVAKHPLKWKEERGSGVFLEFSTGMYWIQKGKGEIKSMYVHVTKKRDRTMAKSFCEQKHVIVWVCKITLLFHFTWLV